MPFRSAGDVISVAERAGRLHVEIDLAYGGGILVRQTVTLVVRATPANRADFTPGRRVTLELRAS